MNRTSLKITRLLFLLIALISITQYACKKENDAPPVIRQVRQLDSTKRDSFFTKALPGTLIVIEGQNFNGTQNIFINDIAVPFNSALMSNSSIVLKIPSDIPTEATQPGVSNNIRLVTNHGETSFSFTLVPPSPSITSISNEMALPGATITIAGSYFYGVQKVVFPGGIEVTNITTNADGTQITVTVPANVTASGLIQVVGKYGTGVNQYIQFNGIHQAGMLANFEDGDPNFGWAWWGGIKTNEAAKFPGNRGNYIEINPSGVINAGDAAWYTDNRAVNVSANPLVPASNINDPIGNYALKFEMYQKSPWSDGALQIRLGNPWTYSYMFTPYTAAPANTYQTNKWVTITIPLAMFKNSSGAAAPNLSTLIKDTNGDMGIMLVNNGSTPIAQYDAAFDNIRIVRVQ